MLNLILVRHAQTVANVEKRWVGWGRTELTDLGRRQVDATAWRLSQEVHDGVALYSSPLLRAVTTARPIGQRLGLEPILVDDLREVNFGAMDGITLEEMASHHPELFAQWQNKADSTFTWPGGDRRADFFRRVARSCERLMGQHDGGTVIVVGHGGTLRACLVHLVPGELGEWWSYGLGNCAITRLARQDGAWHLVALNDRAHLPEAPPAARGQAPGVYLDDGLRGDVEP